MKVNLKRSYFFNIYFSLYCVHINRTKPKLYKNKNCCFVHNTCTSCKESGVSYRSTSMQSPRRRREALCLFLLGPLLSCRRAKISCDDLHNFQELWSGLATLLLSSMDGRLRHVAMREGAAPDVREAPPCPRLDASKGRQVTQSPPLDLHQLSRWSPYYDASWPSPPAVSSPSSAVDCTADDFSFPHRMMMRVKDITSGHSRCSKLARRRALV